MTFLALLLALAPADNSMTKKADRSMDQNRMAAMIHQVNREEIDAGKLAAKMGHSQDVKEYGHMLVDDHTQADKDLMTLAKKANLEVGKSKLTADDEKKLQVSQHKM